MNGDAELNQTRRFDFTAKTDRAVISRTRRITASKTADMESTSTGTKWACGNAVVAARIFAVNGNHLVRPQACYIRHQDISSSSRFPCASQVMSSTH